MPSFPLEDSPNAVLGLLEADEAGYPPGIRETVVHFTTAGAFHFASMVSAGALWT